MSQGQPIEWTFHSSLQSDGPGQTRLLQYHALERGKHNARLKLGSDDTFTAISPKPFHQEPPQADKPGYYSMVNPKHGVALIFNNEHFKQHEMRAGTQRDEHNIIETCLYLGYRPIVVKNSSKEDLLKIFGSLDKFLNDSDSKAKEDKVAHDSLLCFILSHGVKGAIISSDSFEIEIENIEKLAGQSKTLNSKPKMFFLQACRGSGHGTEPVPRLNSDGGTTSGRSDIYLCYSTVSGDKSYRDTCKGSWFITEVCKILYEYATCDKFPNEFQLRLNKSVADNDAHRYQEMGTGKYYTQQPTGSNQLTKNVHFFDKNPLAIGENPAKFQPQHTMLGQKREREAADAAFGDPFGVRQRNPLARWQRNQQREQEIGLLPPHTSHYTSLLCEPPSTHDPFRELTERMAQDWLNEDRNLSMKDHCPLCTRLGKHSHKWKPLATKLGFSDKQISGIDSICLSIPASDVTCLQLMLEKWIQGATRRDPDTRTLREALAKVDIPFNGLMSF